MANSVPEVFCRIQPAPTNSIPCVKKTSDMTVQLQESSTRSAGKRNQYQFKCVFDADAGQNDVFLETALPMIRDLFNGKNSLLITYGMISSGKTYTMLGSPPLECGILPRTLDVIFSNLAQVQAKKYTFRPDGANGFSVSEQHDALLEEYKDMARSSSYIPSSNEEKETDAWNRRFLQSVELLQNIDMTQRYAVFISYLEIHNNYVYDLLDDTDGEPKRQNRMCLKQIREDRNGNVYIKGGLEIEVQNASDAFKMLCRGMNRKRMANTTSNAESSRSHTVFIIKLVSAPAGLEGNQVLQNVKITVSQILLVDLAGSERAARLNSSWRQSRENGCINSSLMILRNCIEILRENQRKGTSNIIPYRSSKLTHLLKNFFEGKGQIKIIVCINPIQESYEENIHVLKFGEARQEVAMYQEIQQQPWLSSDTGLDGDVHPGLPVVILDDMEDSHAITHLLNIIRERQKDRELLRDELITEVESARERIRNLEEECEASMAQNAILTKQLKHKTEEIQKLDDQLIAYHHKITHLSKKLEEQEENRRQMEEEMQQIELMLRKVECEKMELNEQFEQKLISEKEGVKRMFEERLFKKQAELEAKMYFTEEKFHLLRTIINSEEPASPDKRTQQPSQEPMTKYPQTKQRDSTSTTIKEVIKNSHTPDTRDCINQNSARKLENVTRNPRCPPVANPQHSRAHTSLGFLWIEHRPKGSVDPGTVFSPTIRRKKPVTKLKMRDLTTNASKYMLMHQEQDYDGKLETQLVKGNIIPSSAGGAQVIFQEVETLQQDHHH